MKRVELGEPFFQEREIVKIGGAGDKFTCKNESAQNEEHRGVECRPLYNPEKPCRIAAQVVKAAHDLQVEKRYVNRCDKAQAIY